MPDETNDKKPEQQTPPAGEAEQQQAPAEETPAAEQTPETPTAAAPTVPDAEAIKAVDEEQLRQMHAQLDEWREAAKARRDVDAVRAALGEQARIVEELNRRDAEDKRIDNELAELDKAEVPALPEKAQPVGAGASAAQLAAAGAPQPEGERTPVIEVRPRQPLLAAAGTEIVPAGQPVDITQLGPAFDRVKRGQPGKSILASIPSFEEAPTDRMPAILSDRNGTPVTDEMIREAVSQWHERRRARQAGVAPDYGAWQGAICEPFDIIRDIPDAFVTDTPVSDIFPSRPAGRGGFTFTRSGNLADVLGGVSQWFEADQAAVSMTDANTWKPCIEYDCPTPTTAVLEWIVACVTFDLTLEMSNPERVRNLNNALNALEARVHEGRILQRIDQLSHGFVWDGYLGALPSTIEAVNTVLAQLTFADRQRRGNYTLVVPPSFTETILIDRANKGFNADETADVMSILRANLPSVTIVESLDASLGGDPGLPFIDLPGVGNQAAAGAPDYLSGRTLRLRLVDPSAAIYAETGEINAGALRDANLTRMNKVGFFREHGFFLEKHGPQPWATIDVTLCADGSRAGLLEPFGCATS